jgi:serine/threonine protein kinase
MEPELWQQIERIYNSALEIEPGRRETFLAEACGGDELLRKEVESLLEHQSESESFIESAAVEVAARLAANSMKANSTSSLVDRVVSHYRIVEKLASGGMGVVYRAKDSHLNRFVAVKVLPDIFTNDPERLARFDREAKLLASLNHPNIASIYGFEQAEGKRFIVMELIEGETLSDRVKQRPIPVEECLKLALQISEALETAHEKGVIHRDLKPANIKITPEDKVKILDFGLAKAFADEQGQMNLSNSPTLSDAATQQGIILGTAAYMSPEQAKGKAVDKRADIWAFGVVIFEMLTGRQLFSGETVSETLAAVLMREPDFSMLPANLHPRIRLLLERCLEKEAKNRYGSISDARVDIQKALADPGGVLARQAIAVEPERKIRMMLPWIAAAVVLAAIIMGVTIWKFRPTEPRQIMRFYHDLPEGQEFSTLNLKTLAVSPDGKQVVYSTPKGLFMRSVNELAAKLIAGSEGSAANPFFSPDGKWIGYLSVTDGKLKKIAVRGGVPVALWDISAAYGGPWWDEDNTIAYSQFSHDIMRISADGGTPESIVKLKSFHLNLTDPQILPDGKSILYTSYSSDDQPKVMVQSLKSGVTKELFPGLSARYIPTKHIIYKLPNNGDLFAIPFDPYRLKVTGEPVCIVEGVRQFAVSDSGTLAYLPGTAGGAPPRQILVWVNREGKEEPLSADPNQYLWFSISPDGKQVASEVMSTPKNSIWIWDVVRETMTRLTLDEGTYSMAPLWTPDGKRIVYSSSRENPFLPNAICDICWKTADGTGEAEKLASSHGRAPLPWSWSGDGKTLVLWDNIPPGHLDIMTLSMEGEHIRKPLLQEKYNEWYPRVSPDGRWMAYTSDETGKNNVYVRPFPDVNKRKWKVSTDGGYNPLWSPDGRELFYHSGDAAMAVPVETEPDFKPGKPKILFRGSHYCPERFSDLIFWDIDPSGKRFLILKEARQAATEAARKINIVVNWFEELKQRVPGKE